MSDMSHKIAETAILQLSDDPQDWGPRQAPLEMPLQILEPAARRLDLAAIVRAFLPRQRI